jgi:sugar O-acyltransferase (sialic acid O-acetyltransferase NeuD family)
MMSKKMLLIGGGGHCKSVLDSLIGLSFYDDIAIVDIKKNIGKKILEKRIIGTDDDLEELFDKGYENAFISIGSTGDTRLRRKLYNRIRTIGFNIPNIIDKTAIVSEDARISNGAFVGKNAVINAGVVIGEGAIINTGTIIEHDCQVGDFVHLAPGAVLCGDVVIEENVHVGASSVVKQQISIGHDSIIGMGSVVINNISSQSLAYGNPCKVISKVTKGEE